MSEDRIFFIGRDAVPQLKRLSAGESLRWTFIVLPGTSCSLSVEIDLDGPGCEADLAGVYLCGGEDKVAINVLLRHNSGGCRSEQLFKGIAGGRARASFDGLVYVAEGAQKTVAHQENRSILLSQDALVESRPQLEIYADDVECSHGSATGFLNGDELFYMRSRGVPEAEARRLQMISFVAPVVSRLPEADGERVLEGLKQLGV